MKRLFCHLALLSSLVFLLFIATGAQPAAAQTTPPPATKRIGYLEAGPFWLYERTWSAFQAAMARKGDMRCEYPQDAFISPGWAPETMKTLPDRAAELMRRNDLDLVVGMGTAAVKALLAANNGKTPILGMGMADPIAAGVVVSAQDSGADNFTCRVTVDRWSSMFRVFYDVVRFKKMGIMYSDSPEGRVYSAVDDAQAIATELGFSLVEYGGLSSSESAEECSKGLEALHAQGMDAFFIGPLNCFDIEGSSMVPLLGQLNAWKIPTFARDGSEYVKAGALMGFSTWDFAPTGQFLANLAHPMLSGTRARTLSMLDRAEPSIALNLATAKAIGFDFPFDVLVTADELHQAITLPESNAKQ
ncbi:MAG: ABC transporter substrate binding protein [Halodesulfovibrio sp.]